jgi:hypothetical protein
MAPREGFEPPCNRFRKPKPYPLGDRGRNKRASRGRSKGYRPLWPVQLLHNQVAILVRPRLPSRTGPGQGVTPARVEGPTPRNPQNTYEGGLV